MKKCVFSGTFDPPTKGHESVIKNCLKLFDEVVVAVMVNPAKKPFLTTDERLFLLKKLFKDEKGVRVRTFDGAAVDLLKEEDTPFYVRGVRNCTDFEYENDDFYANKRLKEDIITLYIPADAENAHVSSTLVKNSVKFNKKYDDLIPAEIYADFKEISEKKNV